MKIGAGLKVGTSATTCTASAVGTLRWDAKWGLQVCQKNIPKSGAMGYTWAPAKPATVAWSGGCSSHNQQASWRIYCLNRTDFNYANGHFTISNNRINIQVSGMYQMEFFTIQHGCGQQNVAIYINGSHKSYTHVQRWEGPGNSYWRPNHTQLLYPLKKGDYVEYRAYHDGCGNQYNWHQWGASGAHSRASIEYRGPIGQ